MEVENCNGHVKGMNRRNWSGNGLKRNLERTKQWNEMEYTLVIRPLLNSWKYCAVTLEEEGYVKNCSDLAQSSKIQDG